ncbi:MAG: hypothetical protein FJ245_07280 [Nitrospira sp.]|nr:hypothetical protein [Nitrospira sp.]
MMHFLQQRELERNLYLLNGALLVTHEIDAAYWREWELFGIPGGIQMFLLLNALLVLAVLVGFKQLMLGARIGHLCSLVVAGAGVLAVALHSALILAGHPEFTLPASLIVLVLILIVSLVQGAVAVRTLRACPSDGREHSCAS